MLPKYYLLVIPLILCAPLNAVDKKKREQRVTRSMSGNNYKRNFAPLIGDGDIDEELEGLEPVAKQRKIIAKEEKWGKELRATIDEIAGDQSQLYKLERVLKSDNAQEAAFQEELNISFVYASWKLDEGVSKKAMELFLLHTKVDINYADHTLKGATALINAALLGRITEVEFLLEQPQLKIDTKAYDMSVLEWVQEPPVVANVAAKKQAQVYQAIQERQWKDTFESLQNEI